MRIRKSNRGKKIPMICLRKQHTQNRSCKQGKQQGNEVQGQGQLAHQAKTLGKTLYLYVLLEPEWLEKAVKNPGTRLSQEMPPKLSDAHLLAFLKLFFHSFCK